MTPWLWGSCSTLPEYSSRVSLVKAGSLAGRSYFVSPQTAGSTQLAVYPTHFNLDLYSLSTIVFMSLV